MLQLSENDVLDLIPGVDIVDCPTPEEDLIGWLEARQNYIGGSDVAAILGLSKWKTPRDVWMEKTGRTDLDDDRNLSAALGVELEDFVGRWFSEHHGDEWEGLEIARVPYTLQFAEAPWIAANVDFVLLDTADPEVERVLECKTTSVVDDWKDGTPLYYQAQGQTYTMVLGANAAVYAALLFGYRPEFETFEYQNDPDDAELIVQKTRQFWRYVEDNAPLPPGYGVNPSETSQLIGVLEDKDVEWTDSDDVELVQQLAETKAERKQLEDRESEIQMEIMERLDPGRRAVLPDDSKAVHIQRKNIDPDRLRDELGDDADQFISESVREKVDRDAVVEQYPDLADDLIEVGSGYVQTYMRD